MLAQRELAAAMAQPEQRVELLDKLEREAPTPQRADRHRVTGRGARHHLEDRKRDIEPAADVDEPVIALGPGGCFRADGAP